MRPFGTTNRLDDQTIPLTAVQGGKMHPKNKISARCPFRGFDVCLGTACAIFREGDPRSADAGSCEFRALGEISKSLTEMQFRQSGPSTTQNKP
jgi:hypothetical protein